MIFMKIRYVEEYRLKKLLIVDGHGLLFQMLFGMPSRIVNKHGKAIQGTLGFVGALKKIIYLIQPTHVIVIFDGEHENSRLEIDPDYKANRIDYSDVPDEENPFSQLEDIYAALDFMKIKYFETTEVEADDVIASYTITYRDNMEIVISSFDSDFFQLIGDNVSILRYRGKKTVICDALYIKDKYGILPEQYADFKSLTGDSSDNITGAKKIGVKTAALLINQFGSLRSIINNADVIEKAHIRESIVDSRSRLQNNYKLIKLENNTDLKFDLNDILYTNKDYTTNDILKGINLHQRSK